MYWAVVVVEILPYGICDPKLEIIVDTDMGLTCFYKGFHRNHFLPVCGKRKRRPWLGDLPIFKNHARQQCEQRLFEVKPFCPCFDFVSHRNGGSTNLHQVLCEKRIQGCRNFLDVANKLRGCRHELKTSFRW
ncbi:hypothetical protein LAZ67_3002985 [Cordylochernes scorpioides]|uniref:Uncharacterized protein n=1 Tax=Cordylochernes scorpioides TaxID=51811 RepID=A0ABY6KB17_9ARAC|nr:hypothetical protein LAZ67_3002985 [Cordylochernes scorpioides]